MTKRGISDKVLAESEALFWKLIDQPMTMADIQHEFGWTYGVALRRIEIMRSEVCDRLEAVCPRAHADDGYRYHVVDALHPNGPVLMSRTELAVRDAATRLRTINRVAEIGMTVLPKGTAYYDAAAIMDAHVSAAIKQLNLIDNLRP